MESIPDLCEMIRTGNNAQLESALRESPGLAEGKTDQGISLLTYAAYCRNDVAVQSIRLRKKRIDIFEAASIGDLPTLETHFRQHPELLNAYSVDGFTALGLSSFFGHEEIARFLTENGADVNRPSNNAFKVTPLHSSCAIANFAITEMLLNHGANPNVRQQAGFTPLHEVVQNGKEELTRLLVLYGADVRAKLDDGRTPLRLAEEKSFKEIAALLRKQGSS